MNNKQRAIAIYAIIALILSGLFPPFAMYTYYGMGMIKYAEFFSFELIFAPLQPFTIHDSNRYTHEIVLQINTGMLAIEWIAIILISLLLLKMFDGNVTKVLNK